MWFALQATDLAFAVNAPFRFDTAAILDAPAEQVFRAFAEPGELERFIVAFRRCEWKTSAPRGVGAVRQLDLRGLSFREHFLAWSPGQRFCFAIDAMTLPLMRRMVEDVQIEPLAGGKTRLVWTVYYEPTLVTRLVHPIARMGFEQGYRQSVERLGRYLLERRPPENTARIVSRGARAPN